VVDYIVVIVCINHEFICGRGRLNGQNDTPSRLYDRFSVYTYLIFNYLLGLSNMNEIETQASYIARGKSMPP
jgi:hypothetical protein